MQGLWRLLTAMLAAAAAVCLLLVGLYLTFPWLAGMLAVSIARDAGIDVSDIVVSRPGWDTLAIAHLAGARGETEVDARDILVTFSAAALLNLRLDAVTVAAATVNLSESGGEGTTGVPAVLPDPEILWRNLPIDRFAIDDLTIRVAATDLTATGAVLVDPTHANTRLLMATPLAPEPVTLDLTLDRGGRLSLDARGANDSTLARVATDLADDHTAGEPIAAEIDLALSGPWLDQLTSLFDARGSGALTANGSITLPWPLPESPSLATADGALEFTASWTGVWQSRQVDAAINGAVSASPGRWELALARDNRVSVTLPEAEGTIVTLTAQDRGWRLSGTADRLDGSGGIDIAAAHDRGAAKVHVSEMTGSGPYGIETIRAAAAGNATWDDYRVAGSAIIQRNGDTISIMINEQTVADVPEQIAESGSWTLAPMRVTMGAAGRLTADTTRNEIRSVGPLALSVSAPSFSLGGTTFVPKPLAIAVDSLVMNVPEARLSAKMDIANSGRDFRVPLEARYDLTDERLQLTVDADINVKRPLLASLVDNPKVVPADLASGRLKVNGRLDDSPARSTATFTLRGERGKVPYDGYLAEGVSSTLEVNVADDSMTVAGPVSIARIDVGIPITDITMHVSIDDVAAVASEIDAHLLDGTIHADRVTYPLVDGAFEPQTFDTTISGIDLAQALALEGEIVTGTGTLDGTLPVTLTDTSLSVRDGRVRARPPGGLIRYRDAPSVANSMKGAGVEFALAALGDFQYTVLDIDVGFHPDGELVLAMRLQGRNPAIERGRPIHYNLTVTENVFALLESVMLADELSQKIERRVTKPR